MSDRLSHASGALADIYFLITDCLWVGHHPDTHKLAESVLLRMLCSAHKVQRPPSRYRFDWEKKAWDDYLSGQTKACGTDKPCYEEAQRLASQTDTGREKNNG